MELLERSEERGGKKISGNTIWDIDDAGYVALNWGAG